MSAIKRLFFDAETSPCVGYFWRPGPKVNISYRAIKRESAIICICYKWEHEKEVRFLTWDRDQCDKAMITKFSKVMAEADEIVAHNGDRFDIPWFRTRCLFHRIPCFPKYISVDTLKKSRAGFRFNSNRLDYIGGYLNLGKKLTHDSDLWDRVMDKNKAALAEMVEYCQQDVKLLESVYQTMQPYIPHRTHDGVQGGGYKHHCPNCGSMNTKRNRRTVTAAGTFQVQMLCNDCLGKNRRTYWTMGEATYDSEVLREKSDAREGKQGVEPGPILQRRLARRR